MSLPLFIEQVTLSLKNILMGRCLMFSGLNMEHIVHPSLPFSTRVHGQEKLRQCFLVHQYLNSTCIHHKIQTAG